MKKVLSVLLAISLILTMTFFILPYSSAAIAPEVSPTKLSNGTTGECTWELNGTELTVKGSGAMANYFDSRGPWGYEITKLTVEDGVTSIGYYAFINCSKLTEVALGSSVAEIATGAFYGCSSLTSIIIPDSVTEIGASAFNGCSSLTDVTLGNSVKSINAAAFKNTNINSITIPASLTKLDSEALCTCETVILNSRSASIDGFFRNYTSLEKAIIEDGLENIGSEAFKGCSKLSDIQLPDSVKSIDERAFEGCAGLNGIVIPNSVTAIGDYAFYNCSELKNAVLGKSITSIGEAAFYKSGLMNIIIPDGVTEIGDSAFGGCSNLTAATIPASVTSIGNYTFNNCSSLTIYGEAESYAEQYADSNQIPFVSGAAPQPSVGILGDVDGDKKVDVFDASAIQKSIAGLNGYISYTEMEKNDIRLTIADVDGDCKVDIFDASLIQKWIAGDTAALQYGIGQPI